MWRLAKVVRRGQKSSGSGIENRSGYRSAVVETGDGKRWFISDQTYCVPYFNNGPVPDTKRDKNGPFPYPGRGSNWVIIDTTKSKPKPGPGLHPIPRAWMLASVHRKELGRCLANSRHVKSIAQPGLLALIWDYMDASFGPTSREDWLTFERRKVAIARQGVTPGYMEFTKSYYLLGHHLCTALSLLE